MKACVLVGVAPEAERPVARRLARLDGVKTSFPVLGRPEVVVRAEVADMSALGELLGEVSETEGVLVSETLLEIPEEAIA